MTKNDFISLLEKQELENALYCLKILVQKTFTKEEISERDEFLKSIILISGNFSAIKKDEVEGTKTPVEIATEKTKIAKGILSLIEQIANDKFDSLQNETILPELKSAKPLKRKPINIPPDLSKGNEYCHHFPEVKKFLYTWLDRKLQEEMFNHFFTNNQSFTSPTAFIVHGEPNCELCGVVERAVNIVSDKFHCFVEYLKLGSWPESGNIDIQQSALKNKLKTSKGISENLQRNLENADWSASAKNFCEDKNILEKVIFFRLEISAEKWNSDSFKTLDWFLSTYWNFKFEKRKQPIFLFLNFVYDSTKDGWLLGRNKNKALENDIAKLRSKIPKERLLISEKLNSISKSDLQNMLNDPSIGKDLDYFLTCHDINIEALFKNDKELSLSDFIERYKRLFACYFEYMNPIN